MALFMTTSLVSDLPYIIRESLVDIVLNKKYSEELSRNTRSYDYSYVCMQDGTPINTIGFSQCAVRKLVDEVNEIKFKKDEKIHIFNINLNNREFTDQSECMPIIPYIDISQVSDKNLSCLSTQIIKFINELDKNKAHGILLSFFREFNDGEMLKNYSAHVSPLLVVPEKNNFVVFIFDGTGFELMGRQEKYNVIQIPTLRKSRQNCFSFSIVMLKKCLSHPEIIDSLLSNRNSLYEQIEQLSVQNLPSELIQYFESISNKVKYIQATEKNEKILNSPVAKVIIKTLKNNGLVIQEENKTISCTLYNKTYKYALKLLNSESEVFTNIQNEKEKFQKQQKLLIKILNH